MSHFILQLMEVFGSGFTGSVSTLCVIVNPELKCLQWKINIHQVAALKIMAVVKTPKYKKRQRSTGRANLKYFIPLNW